MNQINNNSAGFNTNFQPFANRTPSYSNNFGFNLGGQGINGNNNGVLSLISVLVQLVQLLQQGSTQQGANPQGHTHFGNTMNSNQNRQSFGFATGGQNVMNTQNRQSFGFATAGQNVMNTQNRQSFGFATGGQNVMNTQNRQSFGFATGGQNVMNTQNRQSFGFATGGQNVMNTQNTQPFDFGRNPLANNTQIMQGNGAGTNQSVQIGGDNNGVINQFIIQVGDGNPQNGAGNPGPNNQGNVTPAPNPKPAIPDVNIDPGAKVWGDPHFIGAEGGRYDVQGKAGKTYNILSDLNFQVNSQFKQHGGGGATVMGSAGITMGNHQIQIDGNGKLTINGEEQKEDGEYLNGAVSKKGKKITVKNGEYSVEFQSKNNYLNFAFNGQNVGADGVMPHGLWGQTADGDGVKRDGDKGAGAQGGGAIEGADGEITKRGDKEAVKLYEVGDLFDVNFQ